MHTGTQQIYSGGQSGVVIIQPTGAVATASWPPDFTTAGQQTVFIPQQVDIWKFFLTILIPACVLISGSIGIMNNK